MTTWGKLIALVIALLTATPALASLEDIQEAKLPQTSVVQQAYNDVLAIEPMVEGWSANWDYPTPKNEVAARLQADLSALQTAALAAPDNEELLLLTGLAAHYAYNVDVESAYDVAVDADEKAARLAPDDYRPGWFLGIHQCEASETVKGMNNLLAVEQKFPWQSLPIDFWGDYLFCAHVSIMPAHALRAAAHLRSLNAPPTSVSEAIVNDARKLLQPPDFSSPIPANKIWESSGSGTNPTFTNLVFGFAFSIPASWQLTFSDVKKETCTVQIEAGPEHGRKGDIYPNILIVSRQAKSGETLNDFANQFLHTDPYKPVAAEGCPFKGCLAFEDVSAGMYGADGDGYAFVWVFEAEAPEFPGILFEKPAVFPKSNSANGQPTYYRPLPRFVRAEGTVFYLVMLDTAGSVLTQAKQDYEALLKSLQVE
jgi:hypothetical protein